MGDRLTTKVDDLVSRVTPPLRRHADKATSWLDALAHTRVDEAQPTFRLAHLEWRKAAGASEFEVARPEMWPVYRCVVASDVLLQEEATWDTDALSRDLAVQASRALCEGLSDALWRRARSHRLFPTDAATLREYVDQLGGRAVLVVAAAEVDAVKPELAAVVDEVKKVPQLRASGPGYLRATVGGPTIEFAEADWQVGWDRVNDDTARLVVSRTVRLVKASEALRLVR